MIHAAAIRLANGEIYQMKRPARHADVERHIVYGLKLSMVGAERGFITDAGQWLRRKPAGRHAVKCGQVAHDKINWNLGLFSEDVW